MALRQIVQDGDPILKKKCRPVTNFDDRLATLLDDMRETLADAEGYGLAGPQVGVMRRVFISVDERDLPEDGTEPEGYVQKFVEFINPEILTQEGEVMQYEGCLSFPGHNAAIKRPEKVTVRAFDRSGKPFTMEADGMLARCICHEGNHLDGITIMDLAEYFYEDLEHDDEADDDAPKKLTAEE
ncbi:MAG: peptide deformylase [Ruthenibacterium sp.]